MLAVRAPARPAARCAPRSRSPGGCSARLLAGWVAGFAVAALAVGSVAKTVGDIIGDSQQVRDAIAKLGGTDALSDAYLAASLQLLGLHRRRVRRAGRAAAARRGGRRPRGARAGHPLAPCRLGRAATC